MLNKNIKKLIIKSFIGIEILAFGYTYLFGKNGIYQLNQLYNQNEQEKESIENLKSEIKQIEIQIKEWNSDSFYKEQIARENLQMAHKDDKIYFISKSNESN